MGWFDGTIPRPPLVLFAEGLLEVIEGAAAGALAGRPAALLGGLVEVSRPGAAVEQAIEDVVVVGGHRFTSQESGVMPPVSVSLWRGWILPHRVRVGRSTHPRRAARWPPLRVAPAPSARGHE